MGEQDTPRYAFAGEPGPELITLDAGEVVLPVRYVCSRCQRGQHARCDEVDCECCGGDGG